MESRGAVLGLSKDSLFIVSFSLGWHILVLLLLVF